MISMKLLIMKEKIATQASMMITEATRSMSVIG